MIGEPSAGLAERLQAVPRVGGQAGPTAGQAAAAGSDEHWPGQDRPAMDPATLGTEAWLNDPLACRAPGAAGSQLPVCRAGSEPASELCKDSAHRFLLALAEASG